MRMFRRCSRLLAALTSLTLLCGTAALSSAAQSPDLTLERTDFTQGEDITAQYTGTSGKDWVAIYKKGDAPGDGGPASLVYEYTSKTGQPDGTMDFKDTDRGDVRELEPGEYDMYLLRDDGYDVLAKASFTVKKAAPAVSTDKTAYALGETPVFSYTGSDHQDAWIGVYAAENKTPGDANPSLVWQYTRNIGQPAGSTDLKGAEVTIQIQQLPAGA